MPTTPSKAKRPSKRKPAPPPVPTAFETALAAELDAVHEVLSLEQTGGDDELRARGRHAVAVADRRKVFGG